MVKRLLCNALVIFFASIATRVVAETGPVVSVKEGTYHFGKVVEGTEVSHLFEIANTGDIPLILNKVVSGCGCTTTSPLPIEIAPGDKGALAVSFSSEGFSGEVRRSIRVFSNDPKLPFAVLSLQGRVEPLVSFSPKRLFFPKVFRGEESEVTTLVKVSPTSSWESASLKVDSLHPSVSVEKSSDREFRVSLIPDEGVEEEIRSRISVRLVKEDGSSTSEVLPFYAGLAHPLAFSKKRLKFTGAGQAKSVRLVNRATKSIFVSGVEVSNPLISASLRSPTEEGQKGFVVEVSVDYDNVESSLRGVVRPLGDDGEPIPGVAPLLIAVTKPA